MSSVITDAGRGCIESVRGLGRLTRFASRAVRVSFTSRPRRSTLVPVALDVGVMSLPVVLLTGAFIGMVIAVQTFYQLNKLGAENAVGMIINISMVKELGPVLAAVILAGRVGGAMTAQLGTMRVTEQIDALDAMGVDPVRYLVAPRFLVTLLLTPLLTAFSDVIGVIGGWFVSTHGLGITSFHYWDNTGSVLVPWDIYVGIFKSVFFGATIGLIACYKGFHTEGGAEGVGRATTQAFVATFITILVSNFFLTLLFQHIYESFIAS